MRAWSILSKGTMALKFLWFILLLCLGTAVVQGQTTRSRSVGTLAGIAGNVTTTAGSPTVTYSSGTNFTGKWGLGDRIIINAVTYYVAAKVDNNTLRSCDEISVAT
jgi:hypothetical protein